MSNAQFASIATWLHLIDTSSLPGVKAFEVDSCSSNNLLPQLQVFPQCLDHWKRQKTPSKTFFVQFIRSNIWQWSCIDIRHERVCVWHQTLPKPPPKNQKRNTHHLQRKSAASSTPLQTETSDPSGVLSSSLACPEPTADLEGQSKTNIIVMC